MQVVLVVADDMGVREALLASLRESSVVFVEASAEDALRRMITVPADVIIVDDTPRLGVNALARMRSAAPNVPVVALLSRGDTETRASYVVAGARLCISKPFSYEDLIDGLNEAVSLARLPVAVTTQSAPQSAALASVDRHQTALRWLSRATANLDDPDRLSELLVEALTDVFGAARSAVLLEQAGAIRVAASQGLPQVLTDSFRLDYTAGLMRSLEHAPVLTDRISVADPTAAKEMQLLGARLAVPLLCAGRVSGALVIGDMPSGRDYTTDDRELLALLARTAGTALENAYRYRRVSDQQDQLFAIVSRLTSGMVVVSADKTVTMMNESAENLLQLRSKDVIGRTVQRLGSAFADVALRALIEGRALIRQEVRDVATGSQLGVSAAPVGEHGVALIFAKLPPKEAAAAPVSEDVLGSPYWEFLSARVAQEVKNPLVAINTFAQLLPRKYESTEFRNQFSEVVQKEVARINRVVEALYDFARPPRLVWQRTSVNDVVQSVLATFDQKMRVANIELSIDFDTTNPNAELDSLYFAQAVHNVLLNAIEAMPDGGRLKITTRGQGDGCEVTITDTGYGIAPENAPLVFLPFFSTRETGMGLGLSVAHRIMQQHHGDLRLVSSQSGATFVFFVPARGPVSAPAESPRSIEHATSGLMHEDRSGR